MTKRRFALHCRFCGQPVPKHKHFTRRDWQDQQIKFWMDAAIRLANRLKSLSHDQTKKSPRTVQK